VEKALQGMQRQGMLRRRYRHIVVTDPLRLRRFAGQHERNSGRLTGLPRPIDGWA
jgi:hypothetical protein